MAGFVKLGVGILESTLWSDRDARDLFITALLMASPHELREPAAELQTNDTAPTGWVVPPGWYGFVPAAGIGIVRRAGMDREAGMRALASMAKPDPESRSPEHDGRRMVRVDGGFIILNYMKYRDRDYTAAERMKRWRDRKKKALLQRDAVDVTRNITQAEAEYRVPEVPPLKGPPRPDGRKPTSEPKAAPVPKPDDVSEQVWKDWLVHRKRKRAAVTPTALAGIRREATTAGMALEAALVHSIAQGWQGFRADWIVQQRGSQRPSQRRFQETPVELRELTDDYKEDP